MPEQTVGLRQIASPKRGTPERSGLHAWLPYYAGFSSEFVSDTIAKLQLGPSPIVLDPMNGSGTTSVMAQQLECLAIGVELNPVMAIMAAAKDGVLSSRQAALEGVLVQMSEALVSLPPKHTVGSESARWFPGDVFLGLKRLEAAIGKVDAPPFGRDVRLDQALRGGGAIVPSGLQTLLRAALLIAARDLANPSESRNPTWFRPGQVVEGQGGEVYQHLATTARRLMDDLTCAFSEVQRGQVERSSSRVSTQCIVEGDARQLPINDSCIDAIVTSPPYLTRIDYAVTTAPELVFLGLDTQEAFHRFRSSVMGSTCIVPGEHTVSKNWGPRCTQLIEDVRSHPSKASAGYYFKTFVQYFRDAEDILRECLRVLRPGASAVFVVQDSWYKDVHVHLGEIYAEMALMLGASRTEVLSEYNVRVHMGLVNTRSRKYSKGEIFERVVRVVK